MHVARALVPILLAAAIGAASVQAATVSPWGKRADPLCAAATAKLKKIAEPTSVKASAPYYAAVRAITIDLTVKLKAIPAPTPAAKQALKAQGVVNTAIGKVVTAARTGSESRLNAAFAGANAADAKADAAFKAAGAPTCAD